MCEKKIMTLKEPHNINIRGKYLKKKKVLIFVIMFETKKKTLEWQVYQ